MPKGQVNYNLPLKHRTSSGQVTRQMFTAKTVNWSEIKAGPEEETTWIPTILLVGV